MGSRNSRTGRLGLSGFVLQWLQSYVRIHPVLRSCRPGRLPRQFLSMAK